MKSEKDVSTNHVNTTVAFWGYVFGFQSRAADMGTLQNKSPLISEETHF